MLRTERLVLVPVSAEVAQGLVAGVSALPAGPGWPGTETVAGLRSALEYGGDLGWLAVLDGVVVGDCGTHGTADGEVEIRYEIAPAYRRRGLASEVVAALTRWALAEPDVRRVVARRVLADNVASRRTLERCGYALDEVGERYVDYAIGNSK
ncbi:MAG TPA: GNAT family N-acetyltransferase [Mycobacteriales bacterium]|jgi:RimJ/RimL family protein N-acetyltransferase|nr:GNAT family N-acetyltransferase [Mycobacteriales bacterium]